MKSKDNASYNNFFGLIMMFRIISRDFANVFTFNLQKEDYQYQLQNVDDTYHLVRPKLTVIRKT